MKILTFDTSLNKMFVTLANRNETISSKIVCNTEEKYHSAYLIPTIIELLKEQSLTMQDIDALGVNIGPGSFTGIRACVTVARVMAQMLDIPILGVPSLQIISFLNNTQKKTAVIMDARKNKAYFGLYSSSNDELKKPALIDIEEVFELLKNKDYFIITDKKMQKILEEQKINSTNFENEDFNFGIGLSKLVFKQADIQNDSFKWYNLKPLYIQPPPISMPKVK